jgi:hypothetical protein
MHATCGVLVGHPGSRGLGRLGPQSTNMHPVDLMCTFEAFVHQVSDRGRENFMLTAFDYTFLNDELLPAGKLKPVSRILRRGDRFTLDVAIIV